MDLLTGVLAVVGILVVLAWATHVTVSYAKSLLSVYVDESGHIWAVKPQNLQTRGERALHFVEAGTLLILVFAFTAVVLRGALSFTHTSFSGTPFLTTITYVGFGAWLVLAKVETRIQATSMELAKLKKTHEVSVREQKVLKTFLTACANNGWKYEAVEAYFSEQLACTDQYARLRDEARSIYQEAFDRLHYFRVWRCIAEAAPQVDLETDELRRQIASNLQQRLETSIRGDWTTQTAFAARSQLLWSEPRVPLAILEEALRTIGAPGYIDFGPGRYKTNLILGIHFLLPDKWSIALPAALQRPAELAVR